MATTLNPGTGGDVFATDEISGEHHQRVKISHGIDGSATDTSATDPLPVTDAGARDALDNSEIREVLEHILVQLKLTNLYLENLYGEHLEEKDLDDE